MTYSNIYPLDRAGLSLQDKRKLDDYDITDFSTFKVGDHFRYTQNKYRENGRKLAYGVLHGIDKENKILEVNGYTNNDEEQKFPNWHIDISNKYKNYVFYSKTRNNKFYTLD